MKITLSKQEYSPLKTINTTFYNCNQEKVNKYLSSPFPRLCAHRGLSFAMPENTIPAFAAAVACGAHEIEFDLWLSSDGVPVVCHDIDLKRVAGVDMIIPESSWQDISQVDLGIIKGKEWSGIKIPRFEDILKLADGSFGLNIHIKNPGKNGLLVKMVSDLLKKHGLLDCAYIGGEEDVLEAALALTPNITRACLALQNQPDKQLEIALKYDCQRIQFFPGFSQKHINTATEAGMIKNLFYSDDYADAMNYIDKGIDVILTNKAHHLINMGIKAI